MHPALRLTFAGLLLLAVFQARADVYGFVDEKGIPNYTDIPSDRRARLLWRDARGPKAIFLPLGGNFLYKFPAALLPEVEAAARTHSLDPLLLKALVSIESRANPRARSPKGAMGLTQLMPGTAKRYGVTNAYDVRQNLNGGARYLRELLTLFREDVHLALAAFNAGENAVIRHGNRIPPYEETQRYVPAVLEQMAIFRRQNTPRI
ncbi:transglycosylase SLT domain-containing protein [Uliginosibacterium sp. 31-16]|uniref:transglycosylase SLT domain-containing protein n=1 Tax=Uliginosibacterium sp. 31-16 TaxID=3068315 RepID=UPI00273FFA8C|nr:transglycosylase SLT domain-containing protein [Uliginosibacterium sp. 31-16]MDP5240939.1 transglycosylase SLT domain-containing protein [Uliginosibacterium sp. 31-16]